MEIEFGDNYQTTNVWLNGKKLKYCQAVHISIRVGKPNRVVLEMFEGLK